MGFFDRFKRPASAPRPVVVPIEQREPTVIVHGGATVTLPMQWKRAADDQQEPGAVEYRNTFLPEQVFVTARPFQERIDEAHLHNFLVAVASASTSAVSEKVSGASITPHEVRRGNGQIEVRVFVYARDFQAAFLNRGDLDHAVTISLYRYLDRSKLDLTKYASAVFDLVRFEPQG